METVLWALTCLSFLMFVVLAFLQLQSARRQEMLLDSLERQAMRKGGLKTLDDLTAERGYETGRRV